MYQGNQYVQYRPVYSSALLDRILARCEGRQLAWDCCTGNGQLATLLADQFEEVIASDISLSQLHHAVIKPNIQFRLEDVIEAQLPSAVLDLVTIAQALHWLNRDKFYGLVAAALRPGGILAVVNYLYSTDTRIAAISRFFIQGISDEKTLRMLQQIEQGYATDRPQGMTYLGSESVAINSRWNLSDYLGFLETISVTKPLKEEDYRQLMAQCREMAGAIWSIPEEKIAVQRNLYVNLFKRNAEHV